MGFSVPHITKLFQVGEGRETKLFVGKERAELYSMRRFAKNLMAQGPDPIREVMAFVVEETGSTGITKHYFLASKVEVSE